MGISYYHIRFLLCRSLPSDYDIHNPPEAITPFLEDIMLTDITTHVMADIAVFLGEFRF